MDTEVERQSIEQIFQKVDRDLYEAMATVELLRQPTYDQDFLKRFNNTYAAHGLKIVRSALHQQGLFCVARLWDRGAESMSIPILASMLLTEEHISRVRSRRRRDMLSLPDDFERSAAKPLDQFARSALAAIAIHDAQAAEDKIDRQVQQLKELMTDPEFKDLHDSALNWRHKLAHPIEVTRMELKAQKNGVTVAPLKWGDLEKAVAHSCKVVEALALFGLDLNTSHSSRRDVWQTYADAFWLAYGKHPK